MKIKNLCKKNVKITNIKGDTILEDLEPCDFKFTTKSGAGVVDSINGIRTYVSSCGTLLGIPDQEEGVIYVTSMFDTARKASLMGREDIYLLHVVSEDEDTIYANSISRIVE